MIKKINEAELLELAKTEEKNYNWEKSANLYEQIAKSFLEKNSLEDAAKIYKRIGLTYHGLARMGIPADVASPRSKERLGCLWLKANHPGGQNQHRRSF